MESAHIDNEVKKIRKTYVIEEGGNKLFIFPYYTSVIIKKILDIYDRNGNEHRNNNKAVAIVSYKH